MTDLYVRVDDAGRYRPYRLVNGLYRLDVGAPFATPREAIDFCKAQASRPRLDDSAVLGSTPSRDTAGQPETPDVSPLRGVSPSRPVTPAGAG